MNLSYLLLILWARRRVVLLVLAVTAITTLAVSLLLPKNYVASTALVVEQKSSPVTGLVISSPMLPTYISTQKDIISSHTVGLKVVDALALAEQPQIKRQFIDETDGEGSIRDWIADNLLTYLNVRPSRDSNVIRIEFSGSDPLFAAELANAFADAYIKTSLELKIDPARRQAIWFDEQLQTLRVRLEEAQQQLTLFLKENDFVGSDERRLDLENAKLEELAQLLVSAEGDSYDSATRVRQIAATRDRRALEQMPNILSNPLLQSLKADIARAEAKLAEISERYDRNPPQYIAAAAEVSALRAQLNAEVQTVRGGQIQSARLSESKVAELREALDRQKRRVIELQNQRNEQMVLEREVESARLAYDEALQRSSQVRMESQLNQTDIAVLNPAIPPRNADSPKILLNSLLGIFCGALLGIVVALVVELSDRRVRSSRDLGDALALPQPVELFAI